MKSIREMLKVVCFIGIVAIAGAAAGGVEDGQPNDKLPVYLDRNAHLSAQDTCNPGFIWQGAGNPNTTFQRKRNLDAGVELAIKGIMRQGPDIRSTYVDGDGFVHIEVPTGTQIGNPNRAAWNFTYSYDVALGGPSNPPLSAYDAELWIDLDPSPHTTYLKLTLADGGLIQPLCAGEPDLNGYRWVADNTVVIPDDEGTRQVTQNSQNYAFYRALIPGYAFGPAQFDVVMKLKLKGSSDDGQREWTILHVVFDVVAAPTQTP
jgi:hypothetical protein